MAIDIYLNFNGNCREAVEYYVRTFELEEPTLMTFGELPPNPEHPLPEEANNLILHTMLSIYGSRVMFSDVLPGMHFVEGNNISLSIGLDDEEELRAAFEKLKDGGTVNMELQETFWSKCYGNLKDRFGIEWQFNLNPCD